MQAATNQYSVMEANVKIKISSEFIFEKILLTGILLFFFMELVNTVQIDSSVSLLYLFVLLLFSSLLVMVSFRPGVYYDTENLYFKKFNQPERVVPLTNIESISCVFVRLGRGYFINYMNTSNEPGSLLMYAGPQDGMTTFMSYAGKINPNIKFQTAPWKNYL